MSVEGDSRRKLSVPANFLHVHHKYYFLGETMSARINGKILNRKEIDEVFGVALTTIDSWVRRGCPVIERAGKGKMSKYESGTVFSWAIRTDCGERY